MCIRDRDTADEAMERIVELLRNGSAPHVCKPESFPFSDADEDEEAVTISKEKSDRMVDDLLTCLLSKSRCV